MNMKELVIRMPVRPVAFASSIETSRFEAFDVLSNVETRDLLHSLFLEGGLGFDELASRVKHAYQVRGTALGITFIDGSVESIDGGFMSDVFNALFNSAAGAECISLVTKSGYTANYATSAAWASLLLLVDKRYSSIRNSSYKDEKYEAVQLLKCIKCFNYLLRLSTDADEKLFIGSIVNTIKNNDVEEQERFIYVNRNLASAMTDEAILVAFKELVAK